MSIFKFKRFQVVNEKSAMKVNTDGVILGTSVALLPEMKNILDVGTGTGTIALILAQRIENKSKKYSIDAVEIDADSASEAATNFKNSLWSQLLKVHHTALNNYVPSGQYDLIVSNPPYFESSLENPNQRTSQARHTKSLSYRDLLEFSAKYLNDGGRLAFILPWGDETNVLRYAGALNLFLIRKIEIKTVPRKAVSRVIYEFSNKKDALRSETFSIHSTTGKYSEDYVELTKDFYL